MEGNMKKTYIDNWEHVRNRFRTWWNHEPMDYPLMNLRAMGKEPQKIIPCEPFTDTKDQYLNAEKIVAYYRMYCETHWFLEDSYPSVSLNFGPGSLAVYLVSEPIFKPESIWFGECMHDINDQSCLTYDSENPWWKMHLEMHKKAKELAKDDFLVDIPDIVENADILAALRGPQNLCYDLIDDPDEVKRALKKIDDLYFPYYDAFHDVVKGEDGSCSFTAFSIWGPGKTAKIQCDFNVLISPEFFKEFVVPGLRSQCQSLDNSLFHLDGPDAIRHVPALMEINELDGLQWTCGAVQPDGGCERWYPIYDQVRDAGKSLWIHINDGDPGDWAESCKRLIRRYGSDCFYFLFPIFENKKTAEWVANAIKDVC